jgi:hypothetical protein
MYNMIKTKLTNFYRMLNTKLNIMAHSKMTVLISNANKKNSVHSDMHLKLIKTLLTCLKISM